ncbi:iron chelate uptake ABC transporter family permease subunit, partial [Pseudomonas asplenii]
MARPVTVRNGVFSRQLDLSSLGRLVLALLLTLLVMLGALALGKINLSPLTVLRVLAGGADPGLTFIVEQLRLPRLVLAALVGAALAVSGLILQS